MSQAIAFREHGVAPRDRSVIEPNTRFSLHVMRAAQSKLLTIAYPGLDTQWCVHRGLVSDAPAHLYCIRSPPFNVEDIGTVYFRLRTPNPNSPVHLICADVKINGSTIFVSFARADDSWPFVIENNSDYAVALCQAVRPVSPPTGIL
jgi:vacuolar protein sorting-associated protein 13A/C